MPVIPTAAVAEVKSDGFADEQIVCVPAMLPGAKAVKLTWLP